MSNSCSESDRRRGDGPLKRSLALWAAFALAWLACGTTPETVLSDATPYATPPFFEIRGGQGAILQLFGTIHLGPPEGWSFSPEIDRALAQATTLVMEIDLRKTSEAAVSDAILRHAMLPDETSLSKIISGKTARLLQARDAELVALGLPSGLRERLKPWYIALSLVESTTRQTRYVSSQSADQVVFSSFGAGPLIALETVDEQLGMFDGLSLDLQELILQDTLARYETAADSLEELADAWRANDQDALIRLGRESLESLPQLGPFFDVLLDQRNQNWLPILTGLLEAPERAGTTVFVAVGSLHLVGPGSLPDLLRQRGYRAEQPTQALARDGAARGKGAP